jgi:hypothetical protein
MSDGLEFKDKAGRLVSTGDLIIYSVSYGRSPGLSYGKVLEVVTAKGGYSKGKVKVRVHGVDRPWGSVRVNTKPGFLEYSERLLLVDRDDVPEDILAKLDQLEPVYQPSCTCEAWYTAHARECPQYKENP